MLFLKSTGLVVLSVYASGPVTLAGYVVSTGVVWLSSATGVTESIRSYIEEGLKYIGVKDYTSKVGSYIITEVGVAFIAKKAGEVANRGLGRVGERVLAEGEAGQCVHEWGEDKAEKAMQFKGDKKAQSIVANKPKWVHENDIEHSFGQEKPGHVFTTSLDEVKQLKEFTESIASNSANKVGRCANGNDWYSIIDKQNNQWWVKVRNGIIRGAGPNKPGEHRTFSVKTGFNAEQPKGK